MSARESNSPSANRSPSLANALGVRVALLRFGTKRVIEIEKSLFERSWGRARDSQMTASCHSWQPTSESAGMNFPVGERPISATRSSLKVRSIPSVSWNLLRTQDSVWSDIG